MTDFISLFWFSDVIFMLLKYASARKQSDILSLNTELSSFMIYMYVINADMNDINVLLMFIM